MEEKDWVDEAVEQEYLFIRSLDRDVVLEVALSYGRYIQHMWRSPSNVGWSPLGLTEYFTLVWAPKHPNQLPERPEKVPDSGN